MPLTLSLSLSHTHTVTHTHSRRFGLSKSHLHISEWPAKVSMHGTPLGNANQANQQPCWCSQGAPCTVNNAASTELCQLALSLVYQRQSAQLIANMYSQYVCK